jgi:GNAT superfamily N-acetyltransferase
MDVPEMQIGDRFLVRSAVEDDIPIIERWHTLYPDAESLAVNWSTTLKVFRAKGMLVLEDVALSEPIAYFWGSLVTGESILEVRYDYRRKGAGAYLVEHLVEQARSARQADLVVECSPLTSQFFWRQMGFTVTVEEGKWIGRRSLAVTDSVPLSGALSI